MNKYIGTEKLVAEIQRLKDKYPSWQLKLAMDDLHNFITSMQQEQPEEWSEEDETCLDYALWCVMKTRRFVAKDACDLDACWRAEKWLNFLPERFNLLPKQEWSEEDEKMINTIICDLERHGGKDNSTYSKEISWLKCKSGAMKHIDNAKGESSKRHVLDLSRRVDSTRSKPHWKPSEEQMTALKKGVGYLAEYGTSDDDLVLDTLYDDLKKL